jgi:predicted MPP superfamily phosphohydrolase
LIARLAKGLALGGATSFAYGALIESRSFRLRRACLQVLPPGSESIRVLHISDLHLLSRQATKLRFVAALAGLEPDLVVNTGDNIAEADALEPLLHALGRLLEVPGVFVFGSNDYTGPEAKNPLGYLSKGTGGTGGQTDSAVLPTEELRAGLAARGWHDLDGHRATITVRGLTLEFRGTDDAHLGLDDYSLVAGPRAAGTDLAIGVTHAPYRRVLDAMTDDGVELILAGHTHGGQVCVPGWGALITNCDLPPSQAKGASVHQTVNGSSWLHVSAGLGTSPYAPYRFACPPEATLLTLRQVSNG